MSIRVIALVCPRGHWAMAADYESPDGAELPEASTLARASFALSASSRECYVCGSRDLRLEDRLAPVGTKDGVRVWMESRHRLQAVARKAERAVNN